jgi:hypothetical protein
MGVKHNNRSGRAERPGSASEDFLGDEKRYYVRHVPESLDPEQR